MRTFAKSAAPGAAQDIPFEQAMSNIGHAYIRDQAPGLLDYEVGFQLVDRADDDRKAFGIFAFKVGSNWIYAPVFFVDGELKGQELLYIKNEDQFVPKRENWINYLLAKKPMTLGQGVTRQSRRLGVTSPDMNRALQVPGKYASARPRVTWAEGEREALAKRAQEVTTAIPELAGMADWAAVAVADLAAVTVREPGASDALPRLLKASSEAPSLLATALERYPTLVGALDQFYGIETIKAAACAERPVAPPAPRRRRRESLLKVASATEKVAVYRAENHPRRPLELDNDEVAELRRRGLLIKDAREDEEVTKAYVVPTRIQMQSMLTTPSEPGLYELLKADGDFHKAIVLTGPIAPGFLDACAVVLTAGDGAHDWLATHPTRLWAGPESHEWSKAFDGLSGSTSLEKGSYYVAIGPRGDASLPFRVDRSRGEDAGSPSYEVRFVTRMADPRPEFTHRTQEPRCCLEERATVYLGRKTGSKLRVQDNELHVPSTYKVVRLKDDEGEQHASGEYGDGTRWVPFRGRSKEEAFRPGTAFDLETGVLSKTSELRVSSDGVTTRVNNQMLSAKRAVEHLVTVHGLREKAARELLEQAETERRGGRTAVRRVKYAAGYPSHPWLTDEGPMAPAIPEPQYGPDQFMGSGVPTAYDNPQILPVPGMRALPENRDLYMPSPSEPDPHALGVAQNAADQGQKEVFDTAMIASLLKATRDTSMIDEHLSDLMKGLDRVGRLLFSLHYHRDQFSDRYGKDDLPELEDGLRNTFEMLGDLTLFLKQRTVEASPDEAALDLDLSDAADS